MRMGFHVGPFFVVSSGRRGLLSHLWSWFVFTLIFFMPLGAYIELIKWLVTSAPWPAWFLLVPASWAIAVVYTGGYILHKSRPSVKNPEEFVHARRHESSKSGEQPTEKVSGHGWE